MNSDVLYGSQAVTEADLMDYERHAYDKPDTVVHQILSKLIWEVRRLQHELIDPRYMYCGRATRASIVSRNVEIEGLRKELLELKKDGAKNDSQ